MPSPVYLRALEFTISSIDLTNLRESGLTDETIRTNRLRTEYDANELARILNQSPSKPCCLGGLVIPYRDLDGCLNGLARVRPHSARMSNGQPVKYEQPKNAPLRAYFPIASLNPLRDGSSPVYLTEGEKKALALSQLELAAVGLGGIWCGCRKGTRELIDDLGAVPWSGRPVYIVFDYDAKPNTRWNVFAATQRLACALQSAGAGEVYRVELPPGPDGTKQGADDFLVTHGPDAFRELVARSTPVSAAAVAPPVTHAEGRTEAANAIRLAHQRGEALRYTVEWNEWLVWDECRWKRDTGSVKVQDQAAMVARGLWEEVRGITEDGLRKQAIAFVTASNSAKGVANMIKLAQGTLAVRAEELDADPWLLNCANGTLDLRTGELRPADPADHLTKLCPVPYEPDASCPVWEAFLGSVFAGDEELIGYLQRLLGYGVTGNVREQVLPVLWGKGSNGKSTLVNAVLGALGDDYGGTPPRSLFVASRSGERHPTELMTLQGRRLMIAQETDADCRLNEALIKHLTGGDKVTGRGMYENFSSFTPTHKLMLCTNHKPLVRGTDHAVWRRLKLIEFRVRFEGQAIDTSLPDKLRAEAPGILAWMVRGCLEWQRDGLREPESVRNATRTYATEQDEVGRFITERCEIGDTFSDTASELFKAFKEALPDSDLSQTAFGRELSERGYESGHVTSGPFKGRKTWKGLRRTGMIRSEEGVGEGIGTIPAPVAAALRRNLNDPGG